MNCHRFLNESHSVKFLCMFLTQLLFFIISAPKFSAKFRSSTVELLFPFADANGIAFFYPMAQQPLVGKGRLIIQASRSHSDTHHSLYDSSGRVISPKQRSVPDNTQHSQEKKKSMPPVGFEPAIPASERPQTHAWHRAATGIGYNSIITYIS
jgi:hypothetical protein